MESQALISPGFLLWDTRFRAPKHFAFVSSLDVNITDSFAMTAQLEHVQTPLGSTDRASYGGGQANRRIGRETLPRYRER